jgi:hypothetical protein
MKRSLLPYSLVRTYISRRVNKRRAETPPYRPPDPLVNNPNAVVNTLPNDTFTFIHRPPPTASSPFSFTTAPASPLLRPAPPRTTTDHDPPVVPLPPLIRPSAGKTPPARASDEVVAEIRRLRLSNPSEYSRKRLAQMFGCTPGFVGAIASVGQAARRGLVEKRDAEHAKMREGWGERKALVRSMRLKRREYW